MLNKLARKSLAISFLALPALISLFAISVFTSHADTAGAPGNLPAVSHMSEDFFARLPLAFEANQGQTDGHVKFISRGNGYALFLTAGEAVLSLRKNGGDNTVLRMKLEGANRAPRISGQGELAGKSNYLTGQNPQGWRRDVPNYARVRYEDIYAGVDQVFYGNGRELEYDFIVAPQADWKQIALGFEGVEKLDINAAGELVLHAGGDRIVQKKPVIYQDINGRRSEVQGKYKILTSEVASRSQRVGFEIGEYDRSKALVIDPVLVYSTYLGGSDADSGKAIAIDGERNVYVTGYTVSTDFPTVNPAQPGMTGNGRSDVFVTKINAAGTAIVYSTYVGGTAGEIGHGIDVDNAGNAYVTGTTGGVTGANDFPTTPGAFDRTFNSPDESFLLKLNQSGNALVYSTYTGGSIGHEVKVNKASGEAFVAGSASDTLPTTPGAFRTTCQSALCTSNGFVSKFNAEGSALVYSTYVGDGVINDLAIDATGNAYVTGRTISTAYPITPGAAQPTCTGCNLARADAFVTKLNATGSALVYSTYLGGSVEDSGNSIAIDTSGNAYVTGAASSYSANAVPFPTTPGAFQTDGPGAFITKLNPAGTSFVYSTFIGVRGTGYGIAVDPAGNAHVTGRVRTTITLVNPISSDFTPGVDHVFITSLNPTGAALLFSTFFGPGGGSEIAADTTGNIYVTGESFGSLPLMNPIQPGHGAGSAFDAFVAKIQVQQLRLASTSSDFDGDRKSDIAVWQSDSGKWHIFNSADASTRLQFWGESSLGDIAVPGDYDGDGKTDIAIYRPSEGNWYILQSGTGSATVSNWGQGSDRPVPADYDGDAKTDLAVYRPQDGNWYVKRSSGGSLVQGWGDATDKLVPGDYDGDGRTDIAVFRPSDGNWYIRKSTGGTLQQNWGLSEDKPVQGDYDGDGRTDIAVWRPSEGNWYIIKSSGGALIRNWGDASDRPVPGDYDGDGKCDIAVWRPSQGTWYIIQSSTNSGLQQFLGRSADTPIPTAYLPQ
jgi:hypothetical protein